VIPLVRDTIDKDDIDELIGWLKTYPHLTKGKLTIEYEKKWAAWMGTEYALFVNSGSSANLLMLYSLIEEGRLNIGDKVVVPTLSWSTDLAPVIQLGLKPILCDCNMVDLSIDIGHFERIIEEERPEALILVSVLGLVPQMDKILELCKANNIVLLEDSCESLGSKFQENKIGNFGIMSSFSTYFGHHISTIEGGMICTSNKKTYNILKSIRSHGWDRDLDEDYKKSLRDKYKIGEFESLYKFYHCGFNLRSTDLQAFIGLGQLDKLDSIIKARNKNYDLYRNLLKNDFWEPPKSNNSYYISNFAYPVISPKRKKIVDALKKNDIAVRPLICGSLEKQPFWQRNSSKIVLKNADIVDKYGLYLPNNHQISQKEIEQICGIINEVIN
jgi:CDP-6-deoxy-D-xylo-4-hexulose-3-dehydrase